MRLGLPGLFVCLLMAAPDHLQAGGWGQTFAIEITSPQASEPLVVTDSQVVNSLSFWVGPGTGYSDLLTKPIPERSITNWQRGTATDLSDELPVFEVRFLLGSKANPATYTVLYAPDWQDNKGYIFYSPQSAHIVTHGVSGNWMHASQRWNETIGSALVRPWYEATTK